MKKSLIMLLCVAMLSLVACGKGEQAQGENPSTNQGSVQQEGQNDLGNAEAITNTPVFTNTSAPTPTQTNTPIPTPTNTPTPTPEIPKDYTGLGKKAGKVNYYTDGKVDKQYVGLAEYEDNWYYVKNGVIEEGFTGVAYKEDGLWYVANGMVDTDYVGKVEYNGNELTVVDGKIDSVLRREIADEVVMDVQKDERELTVVYSSSSDNVPRDKYSFEDEFIPPADGLYWIEIMYWCEDGTGKADLSSTYMNYEFLLKDKYGNVSKSYSGKLKAWESRDILYCVLMKENDKHLLVSNTSGYDRYTNYVGEQLFRIIYVKPRFDVSDATIINDSYTEWVVDSCIEGERGVIAVYDYTPKESGEYVIRFDNIEISKDKDLYFDNKLFYAKVMSSEGNISGAGKDIYVHGKDAYLKVDMKKGENYRIVLIVENLRNSELYKNGDVRYSMHVEKVKEIKEIAGYVKVEDSISYEGEEITYTLTPWRKQDIAFRISSGDGTYDVMIYDESNNLISEYTNLEEGEKFKLSNTMRDYTYTICITGTDVSDYVMEISY